MPKPMIEEDKEPRQNTAPTESPPPHPDEESPPEHDPTEEGDDYGDDDDYDDGYYQDEGDPGEEEEDSGPEEKYGSQVLRRVHSDLSQLLQEYDEMIGPLEHDAIKKLIAKMLGAFVNFLEESESHHQKHYPEEHEQSPLDAGQEDKDLEDSQDGDENQEDEDYDPTMEEGEESPEGEDEDLADKGDTNAEEDSSTDEEQDKPTPDEAVEAMEGNAKKDSEDQDEEGKPRGKAMPSSKVSAAKARQILKDGEVNGQPLTDKQRRMFGAAAGRKAMSDMDEDEDDKGMEEIGKADEDELSDHEQGKVREAHGFLNQLANADNFDDMDRMNAFHFHKELDPIGAMAEADQQAEVPMGKDMPGEEEGMESEVKSGRAAVRSASEFLRELAMERGPYGDPHRAKAAHHAKALDPIANAVRQANVQEGCDTGCEPGEMGEKSSPAPVRYKGLTWQRGRRGIYSHAGHGSYVAQNQGGGAHSLHYVDRDGGRDSMGHGLSEQDVMRKAEGHHAEMMKGDGGVTPNAVVHHPEKRMTKKPNAPQLKALAEQVEARGKALDALQAKLNGLVKVN